MGQQCNGALLKKVRDKPPGIQEPLLSPSLGAASSQTLRCVRTPGLLQGPDVGHIPSSLAIRNQPKSTRVHVQHPPIPTDSAPCRRLKQRQMIGKHSPRGNSVTLSRCPTRPPAGEGFPNSRLSAASGYLRCRGGRLGARHSSPTQTEVPGHQCPTAALPEQGHVGSYSQDDIFVAMDN